MYLPPLFAEMTDSQRLELIGRYPLATVIAGLSQGLAINHLPLVWDAERAVLAGHMARANPQWRLLEESSSTVAMKTSPSSSDCLVTAKSLWHRHRLISA